MARLRSHPLREREDTQSSILAYPVPRFGDIPQIDVVLRDRKDLPAAGGGETPIVAIANAIYTATGNRLRSMPLVPQGVVKVNQVFQFLSMRVSGYRKLFDSHDVKQVDLDGAVAYPPFASFVTPTMAKRQPTMIRSGCRMSVSSPVVRIRRNGSNGCRLAAS